MEDDLVYKRPRKGYPVEPAPAPPDAAGSVEGVTNSALPTLAQLQEKQRSELIEMAQVRYGIKGSQIQVNLTPLQLDLSMSQGQIFKALLGAPESRARRPSTVCLSQRGDGCRYGQSNLGEFSAAR
jgi:hypothetical protein